MKAPQAPDPEKYIKRAPTQVFDRVQYAPNYDTCKQTGMESALIKVGKKYVKR